MKNRVEMMPARHRPNAPDITNIAAGKDTITFSVEGGKQLTIRAKMKGKALRLATTLDQFKVK